MIIKEFDTHTVPNDPKRRAGFEAERQMAHYLHREFAGDEEILILNSLRVVDPEQPESNGAHGTCQIDHLVLHRWGVFIVESKSVHGEITVSDSGQGDDEWCRTYRGSRAGIASPLKQAERQGRLLRTFLQKRREQVLDKIDGAFGLLAKAVAGTNQPGFTHMPIQIIVAFSDTAIVRRENGWKVPEGPTQNFVIKADHAGTKIREQIGRHRDASGLLSKANGPYGVWDMKPEGARRTAEFLSRHSALHAPPAGRSPAVPAPAAHVSAHARCEKCQSTKLRAQSGKFGYFWRCDDCKATTTMPTICSACGVKGRGGDPVRIRKDGPRYERSCQSCGHYETVWIEPPTATASS